MTRESRRRKISGAWRYWAAGVAALCFVGWVIISTPSADKCVQDGKDQTAAKQLDEHAARVPGRIVEVYAVCVEDWMKKYEGVVSASATVVIAIFTFTLWQATRRLWESADDQLAEFRRSLDIAEAHAGHMANSVSEAARAANAMEGVAAAMAANVEIINGVAIVNRDIADRQKLVSELQSRAYLSVQFHAMVPQNTETKVRFEPRMLLVNDSVMTPAYKVTYRVAADVLPHPISPDFGFPLPESPSTASVSTIGPKQNKILGAVVPKLYSEAEADQIRVGVGQRIYIWGAIEFEDAFKISRHVQFCHSFAWLGPDTIMAYDAARYNDSD